MLEETRSIDLTKRDVQTILFQFKLITIEHGQIIGSEQLLTAAKIFSVWPEKAEKYPHTYSACQKYCPDLL